jgi:hypothetical protein
VDRQVQVHDGRSWRRAVAVLVALLLLGLPSAGAHAADPDPLWDAYPLEQRGEPPRAPAGGGTPAPGRTPAPAARQSAQPPAERARPETSAPADDAGGSVPWVPLLAGLAGLGAAGGALLVRRRRPRGAPSAPAAPPAPTRAPAAPRPAARPVAPLLPRAGRAPSPSSNGHGAPPGRAGAAVASPPRFRVRVECVIAWEPSRGGSRFRAIATTEEGETRVVADSTAFWWPAARPPILTATTQEAHAGLVDELLSQGWRPTGAGFPWYARRFRRWEDPQDA